MSTLLSERGEENLTGLDIPWRFAPPLPRYNKDSNPSGLILFSSAEIVKIPGDAFLYSFSSAGGSRFPNAMASFLNDNFRPFTPVTGDQILTASGVTPIEDMIGLNIGDPGDGILVSSPIYGRFELDFGNEARLKIVYAKMKGMDSFDVGIVEIFQEAFEKASQAGTKIRAVLISNPSNPLGQCYPPETLKRIMEFCGRTKIHLISDEVYAMSVFGPGYLEAVPFTSVLSIDPTGLMDPEYVQVMYGMSKDFGAAGLRLGCLITRSKQLLDACISLIRFHNPAGPSIAIGTAILEDKTFTASLLKSCRDKLLKGYSITTRALEAAGIEYRKGTNAGLFVYIDLSPYLGPISEADPRGEFELAQCLVDHGVFLHPGEEHNEAPGWFRVSFASMDFESLEEGLRR
ncbi:pyridoxal phosphate-dependent transferase [Leptodontidium sp. 2 PMI_412]|nr:pyridoxal phosphate-dependent transferase [Leptodontidium sp. 2 PMI_412]